MKRGFRIVFSEGLDERVLKAAAIISKKKIASIILLGEMGTILTKIKKLGLRFDAKIIDPKIAIKRKAYTKLLYNLRKTKGLSIKEAEKLIEDYNYFACLMLYSNDCEAIISGAVYSTAKVLKPAFQIIKTKKGIKKASGAMLMSIKNKKYLFADVSAQENPNSKELAEIAQLSSKTFESLTGKNARVAMLSYSTHSAKGESPEKVKKAVKFAKKLGLNVVGEIQLDAAIIKENAKIKKIRFIDANVLIFPNLDAGNIGYKLVERFANADATGLIIQGLNKPVNVLSRGCNFNNIINLAKITVK